MIVMSRTKEFQLEVMVDMEPRIIHAFIRIIGTEPKHKPYIVIETPNRQDLFIQDKDLKRFAKALNKAINLTP